VERSAIIDLAVVINHEGSVVERTKNISA
jgi:hypothetical protein